MRARVPSWVAAHKICRRAHKCSAQVKLLGEFEAPVIFAPVAASGSGLSRLYLTKSGSGTNVEPFGPRLAVSYIADTLDASDLTTLGLRLSPSMTPPLPAR